MPPIKLARMALIGPGLTENNHQKRSEATIDYNCVAWVFGLEDDWYAHNEQDGVTRPEGLDTSGTIEAYEAFFRTRGFVATDVQAYDPNMQRIALYVHHDDGLFTHVAMQRGPDVWASKLGDWEDMEHQTLEALEGPKYGRVHTLMSRPHG